MKKILIPTDFSENASDALAYAIDFIGKSRAHLHIIHVVDPDMTPEASSQISTIQLKNATASMEALELFSKNHFGEGDNAQITLTTKVEMGGVSYLIKEEAKEFDADVIIMGTQGVKHNAIEKFIGTISTIVIENAPCPVILIPHGYKYKPINNVVFSTNLNHSDPYELWRATQIISPHVAIVRCLHVSQDENEDNKDIEKFAKYMVENSPSVQTYFNIEKSDNISNAIIQYAESYNAEMIIMHKSKKSIWRSLFSTAHTKNMVSLSSLPLMIVDKKMEA